MGQVSKSHTQLTSYSRGEHKHHGGASLPETSLDRVLGVSRVMWGLGGDARGGLHGSEQH